MTPEDKRFIVESVGLCWHVGEGVYHRCECGEGNFKQLDPTTSSGMYDHVIPALKKMENYIWLDFVSWAYVKFEGYDIKMGEMYTSPPDLAQALLEYFIEKELT